MYHHHRRGKLWEYGRHKYGGQVGIENISSPQPVSMKLAKKGNVVKASHRCLIWFSIGNRYLDELWCEVVPMDVCHLLLGRPWQYERHTKHDGFKNTYSFLKDGINITLAPFDTRDTGIEALILTNSTFIDFNRNHTPMFMYNLSSKS